jgi:hypothetical protein
LSSGHDVSQLVQRLKNKLSVNGNTYLRLLAMVPAIYLPGFSGSSSVDAPAGRNETGNHKASVA